MSDPNRSRRLVLGALALLVLLAGALAVRLLTQAPSAPKPGPPPPRLARLETPAPPARVPPPRAVVPKDLAVPCWGCSPESDGWSVRYQTDLDLLAPLGDGAGNAALWLKDFSRQVGAREREVEAALKGRRTGPGGKKVLPPDHPLLREAEPWCDQATMRFYPDVYPVEGFETRIPNLLLAVTLARSWVARADASPDAPTAAEDCRRAIRLGRLLRQEDATAITDLIGLACIRSGAQGLYDLAARRGDTAQMLVTAIVLGEHAPQRLRTAQVITRVSVNPPSGLLGALRGMDAEKLADILSTAKSAADRRFRAEATMQLGVATVIGDRAQRKRAVAALEEITRGRDAFLAGAARWCLDAKVRSRLLATAF